MKSSCLLSFFCFFFWTNGWLVSNSLGIASVLSVRAVIGGASVIVGLLSYLLLAGFPSVSSRVCCSWFILCSFRSWIFCSANWLYFSLCFRLFEPEMKPRTSYWISFYTPRVIYLFNYSYWSRVFPFSCISSICKFPFKAMLLFCFFSIAFPARYVVVIGYC